jgi:hypothetical protein
MTQKKRSEPTDYNSRQRQESDQCIFIRCPPPSYEILTVECQPSKKISEVKSEIQAKFELHPSEYILQISGKWMTITRDSCSFADYNIHKNSTLDIKFLHPTTEPRVDNSLLGGADGSAEEDNTYKEDDKEEEDEDNDYEEEEEKDDDDDDEDNVVKFMNVTGESSEGIAVVYLQRSNNDVGDACDLYFHEVRGGKGKCCNISSYLLWRYPP